MSYTVKFESSVIKSWRCFDEWWDDVDAPDDYFDFLLSGYPELLDIDGDMYNGWEFVFESEEHYHWFLLKVS